MVKDKPKGRNERTIPLHEEVYQELLMLAPLGADALVCPNNQGKPWGHKGLYEVWTRLRKRAGVRKVARPVHAGRHYFGTALCRARANVRSVQKLLGHANLNTTMRYVHAVDKDLETAIGDLQALRKLSTYNHLAIIGGMVLRRSRWSLPRVELAGMIARFTGGHDRRGGFSGALRSAR